MANFVAESVVISRTLSRIGYSKYMRTVRQNAWKCIEYSMSQDSLEERIFSGSKAEGLSALLENDVDRMIVLHNTVCSEYPEQYCSGEQRNIFQLSKQFTAPGYVMLQLANICDSFPASDFITDCLVELLPGQLYISSDIWKHTWKQDNIELCLERDLLGMTSICDDNHGPSIVTSIFQIDNDNVYAMVCYCPSYLYSWLTRERQYKWPTTAVIDEVSKLESHVVPVGYINSPLQFMEWRLCYTKGEIMLIRSLPDCLIKVYILMKAIVKVTLKPVCKEISSYMIKNIVLWMAELNPSEFFSENNLVTLLQHGFKFLKHRLVENYLPSYMIPERNLFAGRITLKHRSRLCMRIDCLLREGPRVVLKVKKMRDALNMLYSTPEEFQLFFERRKIIEVLMLLLSVYAADKYYDECFDAETLLRNYITDDILGRTLNCLLRLLLPELAVDFGEEIGEATLRIDPDDAIRTIREADEGFWVRNNPLFKYLGNN